MSLREDTKGLAGKVRNVHNSIIFHCQNTCLNNFESTDLDAEEKPCLKRCLDQQLFFDNVTYEMDSVNQLTSSQGKEKRAYIYQRRRFEDLTETSK